MPQLLHYLKVDEDTRLCSPAMAPSGSGGTDGEGGPVPTHLPPSGGEGGGAAAVYANKSRKVMHGGSFYAFFVYY